MRISDWSSDVCSSDLRQDLCRNLFRIIVLLLWLGTDGNRPYPVSLVMRWSTFLLVLPGALCPAIVPVSAATAGQVQTPEQAYIIANSAVRSEEHTSELQSLMRISYAVFCLKKN